MSYQITIKKSGESLDELFARGTRHEIPNLPASVGGEGCTCALPDMAKGQTAFTIEGDDRTASLKPADDVTIVVNGARISGVAALRNGDRIQVAGHELRFYRIHGRPGVSSLCNILAVVAVICTTVFFIAYGLVTIGLPVLLSSTDAWNSYNQRQQISMEIENTRRIFRKAEATTPLAKAIVNCINSEINAQAAYFNRYYNALKPSQRRTMLQELQNLQELGLKAINSKETNQDIIDLDAIVKRIINE